MSKKKKHENSTTTITINAFKLIIDGKRIEAEELVLIESNIWKDNVYVLEIVVDIKTKK